MIKNKTYYGIFLKIAHSFVFTVMSLLLVKYSSNYPVTQVLFLRVALGAIITFIILKVIKQPISFRLSRSATTYYGVRAIISFVSLIAWVATIKRLDINEATAFSYITPIWMVLSAILFFKEKLTIKHVIVMALNMLGVALALHPKFDNISILGLGGAFITTILWAAYDSICKKQTATEHYMLQCFYFLGFSAIISLPVALYVWMPLSFQSLFEFSLIGLMGVANVTLVFMAYKYASIVILVPFSYSRLLFAVLFSYFLFNILPTLECLIGVAIIITANLYFYMSQRKNKLSQPPISI